MNETLNIAAIAFLFFCIIFLFAFVLSLRKRKFLGAARNFTFALLMLVLSLLFGTISISLQGYSALVREELAATVEIIPASEQSYTALVRFPGGAERKYDLAGDEFYIDAHILKWKSLANLLGIHTYYELDRVAGRYRDIDDETTKKRTVYSLTEKRMVDIFKLRLEYPFLSFLVDAEYGSASFIAVNKNRKFDVMVSTTGLLIRDAEK
jgi:hypothetical protein